MSHLFFFLFPHTFEIPFISTTVLLSFHTLILHKYYTNLTFVTRISTFDSCCVYTCYTLSLSRSKLQNGTRACVTCISDVIEIFIMSRFDGGERRRERYVKGEDASRPGAVPRIEKKRKRRTNARRRRFVGWTRIFITGPESSVNIK